MRDTVKRSAWLLSAMPFIGISTGALFPLVALELDSQGFSESIVGAIAAIYYAGAFTGSLTFGAAVRWLGYKGGFVLAAFLASLSAYALTLTADVEWWFALRFMGGYAIGAYYIVADSWISALGTRRTRGRLFAFYETVRLAAASAGPLFIVIGATSGSLLLVALSYLAAVVPALRNPAPETGTVKARQFADTLEIARCFPFALMTIFCAGLANATGYGLSAVYAREIGFDRAAVALFVSFVLLAPAISQMPIGALADRFRRMRVAAVCSLTAALTAALLVWIATPPFWALAMAGAVVSGLMVPMYALGLSRMADAVGPSQTIRAATAGLFAYNLGAFTGPSLTGQAMESFGPGGFYLLLGTFAAVASLSAILDTVFNRCCPEQPGGAQAAG